MNDKQDIRKVTPPRWLRRVDRDALICGDGEDVNAAAVMSSEKRPESESEEGEGERRFIAEDIADLILGRTEFRRVKREAGAGNAPNNA